ncbi:MAG: hypothetical protein AABY53_03420 [Bdellovibrionota bacterium]
MKKPQHPSMLVYEDNHVIEWGTKNEIRLLVKSANEAQIAEAKEKGTWKELSDIFIYEWFEKLVENGLTPEIVKQLNAPLSWIEFRRALMLGDDGQPYWRDVANGRDLKEHPKLKTTYIISHLLAIGALKGLKRCDLKECKKFFIGPPNRIWCSKKCGSLFRVRENRKNKKKNSVVEHL